MTVLALISCFLFGIIGFLALYTLMLGKWPDENDYMTLRAADYFGIVVITALLVVLGYAFFFA